MDDITKLSFLQLARTPDNEIIKVAGILARIKNWLKGKFSPQFAASVKKLKDKSNDTSLIINQLDENIDLLQEAIQDGDLSAYENKLEIVKSLAVKLIGQIKETDQTINHIKKNVNYYNLQDIENPDFKEKFKQSLPKNFNLELNQSIDQPIKSIEYYSSLTADQIKISLGTFNVLLDRIKKQLNLENIKFNMADTNELVLLSNVKDSILNGNLVEANIKQPSKKVQHQELGSIELTISSAPFNLPNSDLMFQAKFTVLDLSTRKSRIKVLSLGSTQSVTVLPYKLAETRKEFLTKLAEEIPIKNTTLSGTQFAEVMRKGYTMAFGSDPSAEVLGIGWSQAMTEEGDGVGSRIILPCNNVGNIRATKPWIDSGKPYYHAKTKELSPEGKSFTDDTATWRAFASPEEGAASYWQLIKNNYPTSFKWMEAGDALSANATMGLKGYYTASISKYSSAVQRHYDIFQKDILPKLAGIKSEIKPPPGEKPEIKEWVSQYTTQEKQDILVPNNMTPANDVHPEHQVDSLFKELVAKDSLHSLFKKSSPNFSNHLIRFNHDNQIVNTVFADRLAFILQKYLRAQTQVNVGQDKKIDLEIKTAGSSLPNYNIICKVADIINNQIEKEIGYKISFIAAPNMNSNFESIDDETYQKNLDKYNGIKL